jgi:hypothetical protein
MIRRFVDFALNNRVLVLALAILLFAWGIISFKNLPVEAYPDVANNYVQVITQWPGRAAEEVEQRYALSDASPGDVLCAFCDGQAERRNNTATDVIAIHVCMRTIKLPSKL